MTTTRKAVRRTSRKVASEKPVFIHTVSFALRKGLHQLRLHTKEESPEEATVIHRCKSNIEDMMPSPNCNCKEASMAGENNQPNEIDC